VLVAVESVVVGPAAGDSGTVVVAVAVAVVVGVVAVAGLVVLAVRRCLL
jgi:hypothetical protein